MIGLIIVTHGQLGAEFMAVLEHISGKQSAIDVIAIAPDETPEKSFKLLQQSVDNLDQGQGVVIATDLFGGTPSNLAISLMEPGKIEVMAGINLPALVKFMSIRAEASLAEAIHLSLEAGRKYMLQPSQFLS